MDARNRKVDALLRKAKRWQQESQELRRIVLDCDLTEEVKWRQPCYTFQGKNIVVINGFKASCALGFFKGALLKDPHGILVRPGKVQSGRLMKFSNVREIVEMQPILKAYIREAVDVERAGLKVKLKKTSDFEVLDEFKRKLDENPALKTAYGALTPGRQRGYLFYFSSAKQAKTRESRVEKCMPQILKGKGLDD